MDFTTILLTTFVVVMGVCAGSAVQRITHFIDPVDIFTMALVIGVILHLTYFLDTVPWHPIWDLSFVIGYFIGYLVTGRTKYTMVRVLHGDKRDISEYWVIFEDSDGTYLQQQKNGELLKRLIFGIKHEVVCLNGNLEPDWVSDVKYPHFPRFRKMEVFLESYETFILEPPKGRKYRLKRYITQTRRAFGSTISTPDLIRSRNALDKANEMLIEAENENFRLKQSLSIKMADNIMLFLSEIYSKAPGAAWNDTMNRWRAKKHKKDNPIDGQRLVDGQLQNPHAAEVKTMREEVK